MEDQLVRNQQREQWTAASKGWITRREEVARPTRPLTERIIEMSKVQEGFRVLDLACGVGDPAFSLAEMVGSPGQVLGLDISEAMVEGARSWAKEHAVSNVEFRAVENELKLGVPKESFDLCTCRHGMMFMPNPASALKALADATKKGGRIVFSTWGLAKNSPAFTLPGQIIGKYVQLPPSDTANAPGLFGLPTPGIHELLFECAGFENVEVYKFDCPVLEAENPEAMWEKISTMGGPMVKVLRDLEPEVREKIREDFIDTLYQQFQEGKVVLSGETLVSTGT
ncbi:MAG TPA: methyltransferase domain-containing protein, partial [Bacillales bacterium]|nr:methyltransferase domain-containing protein [Bacillales bacterium]